eukprot:CAMPEP_0196249336 /NCGR_PEP_ID=MMETSP0913-20130531/42650_1 /TAXON_ID=49265 /ORGANISM="Thalassiosira rotula, Strain GSO102" /LENGTH=32 /DNA_ID= /DNA_START= /DNA_END= /DNA_ORIENTATION=
MADRPKLTHIFSYGNNETNGLALIVTDFLTHG